ncbi:hypothetical protein E2320_020873, partial [Naja naja]
MKELCDGLKYPECTVETLRLTGETMSGSSSRHLAEVLRKHQRLRELDLSLNYPDDQPMKELCDGLKYPECTVATLRLTGEILNGSSGRHLAEVLRKNQRLRELDLSLNYPDDQPMKELCDGLKYPECTVATLRMHSSDPTANWRDLNGSSSRHLAEVLRKNQRLRELDLSLNYPDDQPMKELCDGLKYPECTVATLRLTGEILNGSSSRHLAEVLRKNQRLRELYLSLNYPDDQPMKELCDGLKYPECTVATLRLTGEILNGSSGRHLAEVLRKNQRLRELDLSLNYPDDQPMKELCDGLKYPECTVETLRLTGETMSGSSSSHLAEVLRKNQRLRTLYLSLTNPDDQPMKELCDGLKYPECTVATLRLTGETLNGSSSRHLAEVLRKNQRLRTLSLSLTNPDDQPMKELCEGLKYPECTVETLRLTGEILNGSSSRHLAEVLRKNQRLRTLSLSLNNPDDQPMKELCEGLKYPECTIKTLRLTGETLNGSSSRHLAEVLRKNQRLRTLSLSLNSPDDQPMKELCDGLKYPECTVETLRLTGETLNGSSSRHLAEVLRKNQRLRTLFLSLNNPDDQPMKELCDGLKYPECTVETLRLYGETLNGSSSRHLAEVLRKNQRLRTLSLSLNNPDDQPMKELCDGLKYPECTVETLRPDDQPMKELCDGLKYPECTVETL